jgi:hypothetical protein
MERLMGEQVREIIGRVLSELAMRTCSNMKHNSRHGVGTQFYEPAPHETALPRHVHAFASVQDKGKLMV